MPRSLRITFPTSHRMRGVQWILVLVCCVLVLMNTQHLQALVRAQFVSNPLTLNAKNTLRVDGRVDGDGLGTGGAGVGDLNGDGLDDFVVGAPFSASFGAASAGQAYLLFGRNATTPWEPNPFDVSVLDGTNGVTLNGFVGGHNFGSAVAGVQDVNGDGCNDMLIGTDQGSVAYLVFGVNGTWPAVINVTQGAFVGVTIGGVGDSTGYSVAAAGDVNNDGLPDMAIGARFAATPGGANAGRMDVLFGRPAGSPWPAEISLPTYVNASTGFSVLGEVTLDQCGEAVGGVGDVNGDGVDDVAVGCPRARAHGFNEVGIVAVVFGASTGLALEITPSQLNGTNGFVVNGQREMDQMGHSLSRVGDVNADGRPDFAIGASTAGANDLLNSGELYVLFGRNASITPWPARLNVSALDGNDGFTLAGTLVNGNLGSGVSAAGDVNEDGTDDLLVGVSESGAGGKGLAYLLYGRVTWPAMQNASDLNDSNSHTFEGSEAGDVCGRTVSLLGDVNGDGRGDLAVGCPDADPSGRFGAGQAAVVFGISFTSSPTPSPSTPAPTTAVPTASPTTTPTATPLTTATPTTSPTASTCATQGAFIPPGATCVNGVLVTTSNTTVPAGTISTVTTSVTITGGASFEQPSGSTLVFVAGSSGSTSVAVQGGGCAAIGGDAVVNFEADPSNSGGSGESGNTGTLVLVTADCVMGAFGSVSATTSFEGDECIAIGDGMQEASGNSISVSFGVRDTCAGKSGGLSTGALAGIIGGGAIVVVFVVIGVAMWQKRKRAGKREAALAGIEMHR